MSETQVCNINFLFYLRFLTGYYHDFGFPRWARYLSILYCVWWCIAKLYFVYLYSTTVTRTDLIFISFLCMEYLIYVLVSIHTKEQYIVQYYKKIRYVDDAKKLASYKQLRVFLIAFVSVIILYSSFIRLFLFLIFSSKDIVLYVFIINLTEFFVILFGRLPLVFLSALMYCRVRGLRTKLENNDFDCSSVRELHPRFYIQLYENIMDSFEATDRWIKPQLCMFVVVSVAYFYYGFTSILTIIKEYNAYIVPYMAWVMVDSVFANSPFIASIILLDLITEEVQDILAVVVAKRIKTKNERDHAEIQKLCEYIKGRPFNYKVWRMVPLNLRALLTYVSFTVTTVIAIQQIKGFSASV